MSDRQTVCQIDRLCVDRQTANREREKKTGRKKERVRGKYKYREIKEKRGRWREGEKIK